VAVKGKKTHTHTEKPKQKVVDVSICMEFVKSNFNGERIFSLKNICNNQIK
jgi:hypothetical protein